MPRDAVDLPAVLVRAPDLLWRRVPGGLVASRWRRPGGAVLLNRPAALVLACLTDPVELADLVEAVAADVGATPVAVADDVAAAVADLLAWGLVEPG